MISLNHMSRYRGWLLSDYFDEETKKELNKIEDNEEEIEDRFYTDLKFGTGGMRGKIGAGTNRMNKYTVRKATQGLANYIVNYNDNGLEKGVVIAYDSRHKSYEFALEAALVLNGNDIKAFLFDKLTATPELSFSVRELNAVAGIVITASHNPSEYNGYKVYGEDGGQVVPEKARKITAEIEEITDFSLVKRINRDEAEKKGLLEIIGEEMDEGYTEEMLKVIPDKKLCATKGDNFSVIYTPLHGTGNRPVQCLLKELGINVKVVEKQAEPDPYFSTVDSPNPEEFSAFAMALKMAKTEQPDLILGTDPDADRMGMIIKNDCGEYTPLTGNQIGVLMADYLLNNMDISEEGVIIKTIVTTEMVKKIAAEFDVEVIDVLTGFKFIGEKIESFEREHNKDFILGFEESYGYLIGTYARDKDAVIACGLATAMTLHYKNEGSSLYKRLNELRNKYGYYLEDLESVKLEGKKGQEVINETLHILREEKSREVADKKVNVFKDYQKGISYNYNKNNEENILLPKSNVLQYCLADESLITIRPSGTEPKLKMYFAVCGENKKVAKSRLQELKDKFLDRVNNIINSL